MGSSPLTRGKRPHAVMGLLQPGIIPAFAGKTHSRRLCLGQSQAHPRVSRENTSRSGVLRTKSVRFWKALRAAPTLKFTHYRTLTQLTRGISLRILAVPTVVRALLDTA